MSTLQFRGSIVLLTVLAASLSARFAQAEEPGGLYNNLVTGVGYDLANKSLAEQKLQRLQTRPVQGHFASPERRAQRVNDVKYRIAVDCWLIRKNSLLDPGYYPIRTDPDERAIIAQAASPAPYPVFARPVP